MPESPPSHTTERTSGNSKPVQRHVDYPGPEIERRSPPRERAGPASPHERSRARRRRRAGFRRGFAELSASGRSMVPRADPPRRGDRHCSAAGLFCAQHGRQPDLKQGEHERPGEKLEFGGHAGSCLRPANAGSLLWRRCLSRHPASQFARSHPRPGTFFHLCGNWATLANARWAIGRGRT